MESPELNPLYKLDCVLNYLTYKQEPPRATLPEIAREVHELIQAQRPEVIQILSKLEKDGYIESKEDSMPSNSRLYQPKSIIVTFYSVTFEGSYFLKKGGYTTEEENYRFQSKKVETLQSDQIKRDESLKILTRWIAAGAIIASVYYSIEIYKETHSFLHRHNLYWIWESIPKSKP